MRLLGSTAAASPPSPVAPPPPKAALRAAATSSTMASSCFFFSSRLALVKSASWWATSSTSTFDWSSFFCRLAAISSASLAAVSLTAFLAWSVFFLPRSSAIFSDRLFSCAALSLLASFFFRAAALMRSSSLRCCSSQSSTMPQPSLKVPPPALAPTAAATFCTNFCMAPSFDSAPATTLAVTSNPSRAFLERSAHTSMVPSSISCFILSVSAAILFLARSWKVSPKRASAKLQLSLSVEKSPSPVLLNSSMPPALLFSSPCSTDHTAILEAPLFCSSSILLRASPPRIPISCRRCAASPNGRPA